VIINLLVGASLKGTLVLIVACAAAWASRRTSADLRHRIWLGALVAVAAMLVPVPWWNRRASLYLPLAQRKPENVTLLVPYLGRHGRYGYGPQVRRRLA
jgi:hypothetical protein